MFRETLEGLLTPCPRHLRKMGYLRELIGMKARFKRCRSAWAPHLDRTCAVIRNARDRCPQRRRAVILGSSYLRAVLVPELAPYFREVVLVDIIHPLGVRWCI